ncbi:hypothetical protein Bbelb_005820 [Branchiostoma belcheri]|nr:hypothetical protein Bbelb_005820 [Branchiostoma belcheri]
MSARSRRSGRRSSVSSDISVVDIRRAPSAGQRRKWQLGGLTTPGGLHMDRRATPTSTSPEESYFRFLFSGTPSLDMTSPRKTAQSRRRETYAAAPTLTPVDEDGDHRIRAR